MVKMAFLSGHFFLCQPFAKIWNYSVFLLFGQNAEIEKTHILVGMRQKHYYYAFWPVLHPCFQVPWWSAAFPCPWHPSPLLALLSWLQVSLWSTHTAAATGHPRALVGLHPTWLLCGTGSLWLNQAWNPDLKSGFHNHKIVSYPSDSGELFKLETHLLPRFNLGYGGL